MVTEAWFSEYYWNEAKPASSTSVGVLLDGNDHILANVIVFDFTRVSNMCWQPKLVLSLFIGWSAGQWRCQPPVGRAHVEWRRYVSRSMLARLHATPLFFPCLLFFSLPFVLWLS